MLHSVLDQRLHRHRRHYCVLQLRRNVHGSSQLVTEADFFNIDIAFHHRQFFPQWNKRLITGVERSPQQYCQPANNLLCPCRIHGNQRTDRVQGVEQEMWMNARFQRTNRASTASFRARSSAISFSWSFASMSCTRPRNDPWTTAPRPNTAARGMATRKVRKYSCQKCCGTRGLSPSTGLCQQTAQSRKHDQRRQPRLEQIGNLRRTNLSASPPSSQMPRSPVIFA